MLIKEAKEYLEGCSRRFDWFKYIQETNTVELYLDHHTLSSLRMCEAKFALEHIHRLRPRYATVEGKQRKPWFLDFGEYLHYCFELFYSSLKPNPVTGEIKLISVDDFLKYGVILWKLMDMDYFKDKDDKYDEVGGLEGVLGLLTEYYAFYMDLRVRVVDTEIFFGRSKEVPLGKFYFESSLIDFNVECYLTGRIDLLIDNGYKIGPVDHKHTHKFRGDEWTKFNPQDAITGYILAIDSIMRGNYPKYFAEGRRCLSAWVYHISGCNPSVSRKTGVRGMRFKATPIDKIPGQLEEFKLRQLTTFKRVLTLLLQVETPQWNTLVCDNIYNRRCPYKVIHEAPSDIDRGYIIRDHYEYFEGWKPHRDDGNMLDEARKTFNKLNIK